MSDSISLSEDSLAQPSPAMPQTAATKSVKTKRTRRKGGWFRIGAELPSVTYWAIASATFVIVFALWCILSYGKVVPALVLPTPSSVLEAALRLMGRGELWSDTKISIFRIGVGFLISAVLAIPVGILIGAYKAVEASVEPLNGFIRYVPVPALIPLVIAMAGIEETAKILLIFLGTYFQMVVVVADVTRQVPHELLAAARTLGANRRQLLFNVLLPATLPGLMETCRTMIGWAWTYLVIAEVVATSTGLGFRIVQSQRYLRGDQIYVCLITLGLLGLGTDMLFKWLQPRLLPWAAQGRNG